MRTEKDALGKVQIPDNVLYGIHTKRALENFNISNRLVHKELVISYSMVKKAACYANYKTDVISENIYSAIDSACNEIINCEHMENFPIDAFSGGAGTSLNLNINEVIANRALQLIGKNCGEYEYINPLNHVNASQSTNDTFPTALKIALIYLIRDLHAKLERLQDALQKKENEFSKVVKMGRTQLQDAVPITLGMEFSAYAEAIARDRWRLYKMEERLRYVNIGGTATGTGLNTTKKYQFLVTEKLREITGIGLARPENLVDLTQNADIFVEVSGLLKACAVSMSKIANDLRLLSSGPRCGLGEINLPGMQIGSSIMPYKINPVIAEAVNQVAFTVFGNDVTITKACEAGQLDLNAFLPIIAEKLIETVKLLINSCEMFNHKCIKGITANEEFCLENVYKSLGVATILVPIIGYDKASRIVKYSKENKINVKDAAVKLGIMDEQRVNEIFENLYDLLRPGR